MWPFSGVSLPEDSFLLWGLEMPSGGSGWPCPRRDQNDEAVRQKWDCQEKLGESGYEAWEMEGLGGRRRTWWPS